MSEKLRILVAERLSEEAMGKLRAVGELVELADCSEEAIAAAVAEASALVVRTASRVTARVIDAAPKLKVIGRAGVGLENIDLDHANRKGIAVVYTPAAATQAVAELTLGLLLAVVRGIPAKDARLRAGAFDELRRQASGRELSGMTLGIVGLGRIGRAVARIGHWGFGMKVVYNDIVEVGWLDTPATPLSKEELYAAADVVSLHVPLTPLTDRLIHDKSLALFKPGSYLVNTARGRVVDSTAVAAALVTGHLAGAAFDVLDLEPPPPDHPLLSAPNCVLSPHAGSRTVAGLAAMNDVVDDVLAVLSGKPPRFPAEPVF